MRTIPCLKFNMQNKQFLVILLFSYFIVIFQFAVLSKTYLAESSKNAHCARLHSALFIGGGNSIFREDKNGMGLKWTAGWPWSKKLPTLMLNFKNFRVLLNFWSTVDIQKRTIHGPLTGLFSFRLDPDGVTLLSKINSVCRMGVNY